MKLKRFFSLLLFAVLSSCGRQTRTLIDQKLPVQLPPLRYPVAVIPEFMISYESDEKRMVFDHFQEWNLSNPVEITFENDSLCRIKNTSSDGFTGSYVSFLLAKDLKILHAEAESFSDAIDGSSTIITVENVILSLNQNPFISLENLHGRYTILLRHDYSPGVLRQAEGNTARTYYQTWEAKFKLYSSEVLKKGYATLRNEYELEKGIRNKQNIYEMPDSNPSFPGGQEALEIYLKKNLKQPVEKSADCKAGVVVLNFIVNPDGKAEQPEFLNSLCAAYNQEALRLFKQIPYWIPGTFRNKPVKAKTYLHIKFE